MRSLWFTRIHRANRSDMLGVAMAESHLEAAQRIQARVPFAISLNRPEQSQGDAAVFTFTRFTGELMPTVEQREIRTRDAEYVESTELMNALAGAHIGLARRHEGALELVVVTRGGKELLVRFTGLAGVEVDIEPSKRRRPA